MAWFKFKLLTSYCLSFNCNLHPQFTSGHTSSLIKRWGHVAYVQFACLVILRADQHFTSPLNIESRLTAGKLQGTAQGRGRGTKGWALI